MGCFPSRPKGSITTSIVVHDHESRDKQQIRKTCGCHLGTSSINSRIHKPPVSTLMTSKSTTSSFSQASTLQQTSPSFSRPPTPPPRDTPLEHERYAELQQQQEHVSSLFESLTSKLDQYSKLVSRTRTQTLTDLNDTMSSLPSGHTKTNLLSMDAAIFALNAEKISVLERTILPAAEYLPPRWEEFCSWPLPEQILTARRLRRDSSPMIVFGALGEVRMGCEELPQLDEKIHQRIHGSFDDLLRQIVAGVGQGIGDAAMKWRVFGLLSTSRMEELARAGQEVMDRRNELSKELLEFVEGLGSIDLA